MPEAPTQVRLTAEQEAVAGLPPEAYALVTAGAGTGKTRLVLGRLEALVSTYGLNPGHEIIVLSFTRSAVREIRNRLAGQNQHLAYVRAYTFDSFATRMLIALNGGENLHSLDFDGRIDVANSVLKRRHEGLSDLLAPTRHLVIDECQDLVGVRATFVQELLGYLECGFTLLGDPAQGIYNFSDPNSARQHSASTLFEWVRANYKNLHDCTLTENFRARSGETQAVLWAGAALNAGKPDYQAIHKGLAKQILESISLGDALGVVADEADRQETTAVLCRNNNQALLISKALNDAGLDHRLQRSALSRCIDPWVAAVLGLASVNIISDRLFGDLLGKAPIQPEDPEDAWRILRSCDASNGTSLNLLNLNAAFRKGAWPDELTWQQEARVIVSTIHKAKGLEFDRVVLLAGDTRNNAGGAEFAEGVRILYVAVTRARSELRVIKGPNAWKLRPDEGSRFFEKQGSRLKFIEVQGEDVDTTYPSRSPSQGFSAAEVQRYILGNVSPGDDVRLEHRQVASRSRSGVDDVFVILHEEIEVGVTAPAFSGALWDLLSGRPFPAAIAGLRVEGIDTVAGTSQAGTAAELGPSGIWARVRVAGLGEVVTSGH